jgi:hypothetical protein
MFPTRIKIAPTVMLAALTCSGAGVVAYGTMRAGQNAPTPAPLTPAPDTQANPAKADTAKKQAKKPAEVSPLGFVHDFGKVKRGTIAKHAFRIVNTSDVPLQIVSVRGSS